MVELLSEMLFICKKHNKRLCKEEIRKTKNSLKCSLTHYINIEYQVIGILLTEELRLINEGPILTIISTFPSSF